MSESGERLAETALRKRFEPLKEKLRKLATGKWSTEMHTLGRPQAPPSPGVNRWHRRVVAASADRLSAIIPRPRSVQRLVARARCGGNVDGHPWPAQREWFGLTNALTNQDLASGQLLITIDQRLDGSPVLVGQPTDSFANALRW